MSDISKIDEQIKQLQLLKEEEIKKLELKQYSLEHNLNIIKEIYLEKKEKLDKNSYSKSCVVSKFQDMKLVPLIEAILNSLTILNEKLEK